MARPVPAGVAAPRVAVVGGGIAGLAAALRLLELARGHGVALEVVLIEAGERLGGKVQTERAGSFVIEQGPDSLVASKPHGIQLARRLGLGEDLVGPGPAAGRTFIVREGRLQPMPEGFALGVPVGARALWASPLFSLSGKLRASLEPLIPPRRDGADESVAAFLRRRLGRQVTERLAAPLLAGIASGDPERLSIRATFPQLVQLEREFGSLVRGMARQRRARAAAARPAAAEAGSATGTPAAAAAAGAQARPAGGGPGSAGAQAQAWTDDSQQGPEPAPEWGHAPAPERGPAPGPGRGQAPDPGRGRAPGPSRGPGGRSPFVTLRGGLGRLPQAAARRIEELGGRIVTGAPVVALEPVFTRPDLGTGSGTAAPSGTAEGTWGDRGRGGRAPGYRLTVRDGGAETVDAVVLAVPAWQAASLLEPFLADVAEQLAAIPYKPTAVVALAYPEERAGLLEGSGFIVPPEERRFITACTWVSSKWPGTAPPGMALLRAFAGRPGEDPLVLPDDELVARVRVDLAELAGVDGEPELVRVYRWPRAMPQYEVGHLDRMAAVRAGLQEHPRLALAGAGYFGVGVPDCIRQGEAAAEAVWAALGGAAGASRAVQAR
ncbi:protoporphyrinogen oxidase [Thermaerobacter subterraneus]|uniref:Coproporphyrinogen III oxidase n=1 Tax=Thermaerobacter subterraneus DSM 13965 TaxID=867903 RepID=K6PZN9_9FIRM|nr:protoporphyrinogen oxidase [Thermaerobacter subterraneus]EKP94049.1 protoporphyrinogen oxidase [Thermaerobacter subterraneus DSM 13965]